MTKTGAAYLPKVIDAFDRLASGTREVFGRRRHAALTLRCAVSYATGWLAPRLSEFLTRHPGKAVRIISSVWRDPFDNDQFDLDIRYGTGHWPGYVSQRLTWEKITPLCAPDMLTQGPALSVPDDLRYHTLLHVLGYRQGWATWLNAAGAPRVDPGQGMQFDTSVTAFEMAAHGGGVALGRSSLAATLRARRLLVAPFDLEVPIPEAFYVVRPRDRHPHPDAAAFTAWLMSKAAPEEV